VGRRNGGREPCGLLRRARCRLAGRAWRSKTTSARKRHRPRPSPTNLLRDLNKRMATTTNKHRVLTHFFALLKRCAVAEADSGEAGPRPVLEQFLYGVCRENATREQADRAFNNLRERFFDWNEI